MIKFLYTFFLFAGLGVAQCILTPNPLTGRLECGSAPITSNLSGTVASGTTLTITHNLGSAIGPKVVWSCYTAANAPATDPTSVARNDNDTVFTWGVAQTNVTCVINASGTGAAGATGPQGPTGPTGAPGEVTSLDSSSVDGQLSQMSGTTGKQIKKYTGGPGIVKVTSGIPDIAIPGTDYAAASHNHNASAINAGELTVSRGGTGKGAWTQYSLPYASTTTTLAEIPIGTNGQCLKVNAGVNGYVFGACGDVSAGGNNTFTGANDFSGATSTKPAKTGTTPPGTCTVGDQFYDTDATAGSNLFGCTSTNVWTLLGAVVSSVAGRTGAITLYSSDITDCSVVRTSSTVLTIGPNSSVSTPCRVRFGNTIYTFTAPATATISAGTGTAYIYVASGGVLTVGHNVTVACASCTQTPAITAFPSDSIPFHTWTATSGTWDVSGGTEQRTLLSTKKVTCGSGCVSSEVNGNTTIDVSTSTISAAGQGSLFPWGAPLFSSMVDIGSPTSANVVYVRQFVPANSIDVGKAVLEIKTASGTCAATCGMQLGIYNVSGSRLGVSTVVTSGGTPNLNATGVITFTFSTPVSLTSGASYYFAWSTDSGVLALGTFESWTMHGMSNANGTRSATAANASTGTGASVALPATLGALTAHLSNSATGKYPALMLER